MRILYLVPDAGFFWSHRRNLAAAARDAGAEVVVATPPGPAADLITAAGFRHRPVRIAQSLAPHAMAGILDAVIRGGECALDEALDYETKTFALCCSTADMREGTSAFLERRKAVFSGN